MSKLRNFALKLTQDADEAEDVLQMGLVTGFRFLDNFERGTNFSAWMHLIVKNQFRNEYRKKKRKGEHVSHTQDDGEFLLNGHATSFDISSTEFSDEVQEALASIPSEFRDALLRVSIEDDTYDQAADALGIVEGTVRSRLYRARTLLGKKLRDYAVANGYPAERPKGFNTAARKEPNRKFKTEYWSDMKAARAKSLPNT